MDALGSPAHSGSRRRGERGQGLVEYGVIVVLVGVFLILAVGLLGGQTAGLWAQVSGLFG